MTYNRVLDIIPDIVAATEKGLLKWEPRVGGQNRDFVATIGDHKIEIEYEGRDSGLFKLYLWDPNSNVIDYNRIRTTDKNYKEVLSCFNTIQRSAANVPSVLSNIVAQLKMLE